MSPLVVNSMDYYFCQENKIFEWRSRVVKSVLIVYLHSNVGSMVTDRVMSSNYCLSVCSYFVTSSQDTGAQYYYSLLWLLTFFIIKLLGEVLIGWHVNHSRWFLCQCSSHWTTSKSQKIFFLIILIMLGSCFFLLQYKFYDSTLPLAFYSRQNSMNFLLGSGK